MYSSLRVSIFSSLLLVIIFTCAFNTKAQSNRQLYQIRIYHLENHQQEKKMDQFLKEAYIPAIHRTGIKNVGIFKPVGQDTTSDPRIYVFVPFDSFAQLSSLSSTLANDNRYQEAGKPYIKTAYNDPLYNHFETILLKAFPLAPHVKKSHLKTPKSDRTYELRSYASSSEALHENKVTMFNDAGEINIFSKLKFNPIFYGDVLYGSNMPNLMYMTTFRNMESRKKHWDAFGNDPKWKEISSMEKYQHNVSRVDIQFLHPETYSDL